MKSVLVALLMILLPLQLCWSAAAMFCQHETGTQARWHWGHHLHVLDASCRYEIGFTDQSKPHLDQHQSSTQQESAQQKADSQNLFAKDKPSKPLSDQSQNNKHVVMLIHHGDHIPENLPIIKPIPLWADESIDVVDLTKQFIVFHNFYQSPILEQPDPPLWIAA